MEDLDGLASCTRRVKQARTRNSLKDPRQGTKKKGTCNKLVFCLRPHCCSRNKKCISLPLHIGIEIKTKNMDYL